MHALRRLGADLKTKWTAHRRPFRWRKIRFPSHVRVLKSPVAASQAVIVRPAEDLAALFVSAVPPKPYTRQRPRILDAPGWLQGEMSDAFQQAEVRAPAGGIALLTDVSILAGGVVATADGTVVGESLINTEEALEFGPFTRPRPGDDPRIAMRFCARQRRLGPEPHILLKQTYDKNYGHWLIECLPRLAIAARHIDVSRCKVIVSDWSLMREVYFDSLQAFGIRPDQIVELGYESAHAAKLIYPLPITRHPWIKSPAVVESLETLPARLTSRRAGSRRLYVSRNRYHKRRLLNERAILKVCAHYGFDVIHPETMSFADQVHAFAQADLVVGNCGASLANIVFSPRGATLLALASTHMHDSFFWDLASLKGIEYVSLHGETAVPADGLDDNARLDLDFVIDVERFARLLAEVVDTERLPDPVAAAPPVNAAPRSPPPESRLMWR